jgi:hypothetical protein
MAILTLVLGVHRSGTSLLSLGLQAAGISAGSFNDNPDPDNPLGYGEHHKVRNFNDRLLVHLGASWDNWGFRASNIDFSQQKFSSWIAEGAALLKSLFPGAGPFLLKDPRIASLAPFWERVVAHAGFELRRILVVREPAEVAESQRIRVRRRPREFPVIADAEPMAALWTVTMSELLAAIPDDDTLLLRYSDVLADPVATLAAAATFAGAEGCDDAVATFAAENVLPSLYRSRAGPGSIGPWMRSATSIFDALVAPGTPRRLTVAEARRVMTDRDRMHQMMRGLSAARQSIARLRALHEEQQARINALCALTWELAQLSAGVPRASVEEAMGRAFHLARNRNFCNDGFTSGTGSAGTPLLDVSEARLREWIKATLPDFQRFGLESKLG